MYVTNLDDPGSGRTFVGSSTGWYERVEGETGAVAFSPVADSLEEVRQRLSADESARMSEMDNEFAGMVREEFREQAPLYPEAPELSDQEE